MPLVPRKRSRLKFLAFAILPALGLLVAAEGFPT